MARVHVTAEAHLRCGATVVRVYPAGYRGPAPDDHIERIVAAGKGRRLTRRGQFVGKVEPDDVT
jgi:hypothetical protein